MTIECVIDHTHHRNILGAKGSNVQAITQEHNVSIKFPDRTPSKAAEEPVVNGEEGKKEGRDIILITGRTENVEAAKQALMVRMK